MIENKSIFILFLKFDDDLLLISRNSELDEVEFSKFHSGVKRGDIVGICGHPGWLPSTLVLIVV